MKRVEAKWRGENRIKRFLEGFPSPMSDSLTPDLYAGDGKYVEVKVSTAALGNSCTTIEWWQDDTFHRVIYSISLGVVLEWETTPPGE